MVHHAVVEVLAAKVGVASGCLHLEDALLDGEEGDVEGAAAEVIDQHVALLPGRLLVQAVRDRRRVRIADDTQYIQAGDRCRVRHCTTLRSVEVRRHTDDNVGHVRSQVRLGEPLHLVEHHRHDLLCGKALRLASVLHLDHETEVVRVAPNDFERVSVSETKSV